MLANIKSFGLKGIDGFSVQVQVDISNGLVAFETVGLPDAAVKESRERVRSAIRNSGLPFPVNRITVNLAPAGLKKEGAIYDLPIALGILAAGRSLPVESAQLPVIIGELGLDGAVRPVKGALPMVLSARKDGHTTVMLPRENVAEVAYLDDMTILPVSTLEEAVKHFRGEVPIVPEAMRTWCIDDVRYGADFSEIRGQQTAKRAAEIAAAGNHNLLLIGTPGSGKTMLSRRMPSILPDLTFEEALEITKIHSVSGLTDANDGLVRERPFRAPHHGASAAALVGGGAKAMPGEISLAHHGVLFLDEFPEFSKDVLESLRQPLEDGVVTITRAAASATYPAAFLLLAAMNPCPCGNFGSRTASCRCKPTDIRRYQNRISGPLLDRLDMHVEMTEVGYCDISAKAEGESSNIIRSRVNAAREIQLKRYKEIGVFANSQLSNRQIKQHCKLDDASEALLKLAFTNLKLSARAYHRILKVARTIADLERADVICENHIAEAIQYRSLDGKYWGEG